LLNALSLSDNMLELLSATVQFPLIIANEDLSKILLCEKKFNINKHAKTTYKKLLHILFTQNSNVLSWIVIFLCK
jgi:hypothetical protein